MYKICHTEESMNRQRFLEAALLEEMQALPYDKITLSGLCRKQNVPRKTFYRYFPTKDDCLLALMDHTLADCNHSVVTDWDGDARLQLQNLEAFFEYWLGQKPFLDAMKENGFRYQLLDRTTALVDAMKEKISHHSFARDQVEYTIAHGLMAAVLRWHHHDFQSSPREMASELAPLVCKSDVSIIRLML